MAGDYTQGLLMLLFTQQLASQEPSAAEESAPVGSGEEQNKTFSSPDVPPLPTDVVLLPGMGTFDLLL